MPGSTCSATPRAGAKRPVAVRPAFILAFLFIGFVRSVGLAVVLMINGAPWIQPTRGPVACGGLLASLESPPSGPEAAERRSFISQVGYWRG